MIEFIFGIIALVVFFMFRSSVKVGAEALEDTSHGYLEEVLINNAISREERIVDLDEQMKVMGIEKLTTHAEIMKRLGR
jgi:hypothetical protein